MNNEKLSIFISHIAEESKIAELIKEKISRDFLGLIDVFVSSDSENISVGNRWLDNISEALEKAKIEIIICSRESISRPWINFEAGAGWVKKIPVVPICHTGLRPVDLPIPLNMLQGIEVKDPNGLNRLYQIIARELQSEIPNVDLDEFINSALVFEKNYGVIREIKSCLLPLLDVIPELRKIFVFGAKESTASGKINIIDLDKVRGYLDSLQILGYIKYGVGSSGSLRINSSGQFTDFKIEVLPRYYEYSEYLIDFF